jgi:hypothetical protein
MGTMIASYEVEDDWTETDSANEDATQTLLTIAAHALPYDGETIRT